MSSPFIKFFKKKSSNKLIFFLILLSIVIILFIKSIVKFYKFLIKNYFGIETSIASLGFETISNLSTAKIL